MNPEVDRLYHAYMEVTQNPIAAANLVVADVLLRKTPEPIIVEPEDCQSYTVKETARRLNLSSRQVYQLILAGQMRAFRSGRTIRITLYEIERYEAEHAKTTALTIPQ